jgi:hypothetical protein
LVTGGILSKSEIQKFKKEAVLEVFSCQNREKKELKLTDLYPWFPLCSQNHRREFKYFYFISGL